MFSFLMGTENGKLKWQCVHCKEIFYTEVGRAQDAELHECPSVEPDTCRECGSTELIEYPEDPRYLVCADCGKR